MSRERHRRIIDLVVIGIIALAWCCTTPEPVPDPKPLPWPQPNVADGCDLACINLERLGCPSRDSRGPDDIAGTDDDVLCAHACREVRIGGVDLNTSCVAAAYSCEAADACD